MEKRELWFYAIINGKDLETGHIMHEGSAEQVKMKLIAENKNVINKDTEVKVMRPFC